MIYWSSGDINERNLGRLSVSQTDAKLDYLLEQLDHLLPSMRFNAARQLGELDDERAYDALIRVWANDPSPAVRRAARIALDDLETSARAG